MSKKVYTEIIAKLNVAITIMVVVIVITICAAVAEINNIYAEKQELSLSLTSFEKQIAKQESDTLQAIKDTRKVISTHTK